MDLQGRLSNPAQRRLSPTDIDDLLEAYRSGTTINQLAVDFGILEMRGAERAECRLSAERAAYRLHSGAERIVRAAYHMAETGSVPPVLRHAHSRWTPTTLTFRDNFTGQHRSAAQSRTSRLRQV